MTYIIPSKVNIRNIRDIHTELLTYVNTNDVVEIDLDGCDDIDISLLQLIESARKSALSGGKPISLSKPANETVQSTLKRAGLLDAFSSADTKFWLHKEVR
jgi:anti-anti-sigma regulatory factor